MKKKVLITGASGGFGVLTTQLLLQQGHQVTATMRNSTGKNQGVASQLQAAGAHIVELDVTSTDSVDKGVQAAIAHMGGLDVVVNNAGVGCMGMIEHFTPEDTQRLFDVNVVGVQRVNRAALPHLRQQGSGLVIYISSLLGRVTMPFYGIYNASKWALEAMAENYRTELSAFGVDHVIVEPGGFPTTFAENLMPPSDHSRDAAYGDFMQAPQMMGQAFGQMLQNTPQQNPQTVADAILQVMETPAGQRPFRTAVDFIGMGDMVKPYNDQLHHMTEQLYANMHMGHMLKVNVASNV